MVKTHITGFIVFVIKFIVFSEIDSFKFFEFKNDSHGHDMATKFCVSGPR